ncbi:MMS19 nucleotide excision repair protein homolog [Liolophura sinensis]|uniref:MMS19 nucleotide excision repair protein homolog n=1 Tax=Liolophura sinensis TaxID=3198878 RepID=UPI003158726F
MAAPMWRSAVEDYIVGLAANSSADIVSDLLKKNVTLVEIVEHVGSSLTNPDASVRARGVQLLADIAHGLPRGTLNEKETDILVTYMVEKLKDHHSIQPHALYGLLALTSCSLPDGAAGKICHAIFTEVYNQSLAQRDRRSVYQILLNLLKSRLKELEKMSGEFVHGFIQALDMEKDPRNLVIAFQCVETICHNLSLGVFVEEMFEVFSCYFPVDFSPPPDDVLGVKREDLVQGLERCMSASAKFAPFCLPLLLEKISSNLSSAKIDSFHALVKCSEVYGASGLQEFLGSLFSSIKREVFSSGDQVIEDAALNALTAIVKTLSNSVNEKGSVSSLDSFLDDVLKDCRVALKEPGLRLFAPTARMLQAMGGSSDPAFCKIAQVVMPTLMEQFSSHTQVTERTAILNVVQNFVKLSNNFTFTTEVDNPLIKYKEQLFTLCCNLLMGSIPELRLHAVTCLTAMMSAKLLSTADQELMADHLTGLVLTDTDATLRASSPSVVVDRVIPALVNSLHAESVHMETDGQNPSLCNNVFCLQTMVSIATHENIVLNVLPEFIKYLKYLSRESNSGDMEDCAVCVCECIYRVMEKMMTSASVVQYCLSVTIPELVGLLVSQAVQPQTSSLLHSDAAVKNVAKAVQILMTKLSKSESKDFSTAMVDLFLQGTLPASIRDYNIKLDMPFQPLSVSSPWKQSQLVCVLTAVVCSLPKEDRLKEEAELLEKLTDLALKNLHAATSDSAAKCIGGLVNKIPDEQELGSVASKLKGRLSEVVTSKMNQSERCRALTAIIWLTKALVLRGHPFSSDLISQIVSCLEDTELGCTAADGFRVLLQECDDVMTLAQQAYVKLMYRQRIFIENLPKLVQGFNKTQHDNKKHYLLALSHLVTFVPKQVLLTEANTLAPLMVHSLLCDDIDLQLANLSTLRSLITDAPDLISKHVDSLMPQLLKLSCKGQTMKVRIGALKCLSSFTHLPPHVIMPHKSKVIRALEPALDDHKRLVRKEAVIARGEWFLLGEPMKSAR